VSAQRDDYPAILFVHQGPAESGAAFFAEFWPEARAVADPDMRLYDVFGIHHASARALMSPDLWRRVLQATLKGNIQGQSQGDARRMPGMFMVRDGLILWEHCYAHAGDHPDWDALPDIARRVADLPTGVPGRTPVVA
jgi:hypothetical protein